MQSSGVGELARLGDPAVTLDAAGELQVVIDDLSGELSKVLNEGIDVQGMLSMKIHVAASGQIEKVAPLTNSIRHATGDKAIERALVKHITLWLKKASFKKQKGKSEITLPLVFEAN